MQSKILLAGFEPFGPYKTNVAQEVAAGLSGEKIIIRNSTTDSINEIIRLKIVSIDIPIDFGRFRQVIQDAIREIRPKIAVGLGMDFEDTKRINIELAANQRPNYGDEIKDQTGNTGNNTLLDEIDGEIRIPNEAEIRSIISETRGVGISESAGGHMCETVLRDLIRESDKGKIYQPLFMHLPHTPEQLEQSEKLKFHRNSIDIEGQIEIVRNVIKKIAIFYLEKTQ